MVLRQSARPVGILFPILNLFKRGNSSKLKVCKGLLNDDVNKNRYVQQIQLTLLLKVKCRAMLYILIKTTSFVSVIAYNGKLK